MARKKNKKYLFTNEAGWQVAGNAAEIVDAITNAVKKNPRARRGVSGQLTKNTPTVGTSWRVLVYIEDNAKGRTGLVRHITHDHAATVAAQAAAKEIPNAYYFGPTRFHNYFEDWMKLSREDRHALWDRLTEEGPQKMNHYIKLMEERDALSNNAGRTASGAA